MAVDKSLSIAYRVLRDAQNKYAEGGSVQNVNGIPELRSYDPTMRDRIASYLIGNQRPSPERRGFVQGLMGSSGLGNQGMGLVDFTPAGIPMQAQESAREGDYQGAALAVTPFGVGAKGIKPIRAYHGSPHDFDKFDLSKIGTGEGAQAYGHGLYFAENEATAKTYRDATAWKIPEPLELNNFSDKARYGIRWGLNGHPDDPMLAAKRAQFATPELRDMNQKELADLISRVSDAERGRMYEVNIHADPNKFLDWDAPLNETVINSLQRAKSDPVIAAAEQAQAGKYSGEQFYDKLSGYLSEGGAGQKYKGRMRDFPTASQLLTTEAEIPGIKYLDQGSRGSGQGTRNYVVFDPSIIEILRKYGIAGLPAAGVAAGAASQGGEEMKFASGGSTPFYTRSEARNLERSGLINTPTGGRADKHPLSVKGGDYILTADFLSGIGQGNTMAGAKAMDQLFKMGPYGTSTPKLRGKRRSIKGFAGGGEVSAPVDILISGGEYVVPAAKVAELGDGNLELGHEILDALVKDVRKKTIRHLKNLPDPKKG